MAESLQIQQINALAELELIGWKYEPAGHEEIRCRCPAHEDVNPSVMLNTKKNVWHCHAAGCQAKGDIITFLAYAIGVERRTMIVKLSERYDLEEVKSISLEVVERMHEKVWNAGPLLEALRVRGLTDDDIRSARIGFHDGRLTIPVFDKQKRCVNIRRYLPGAPSKDKMKNTTGYGSKARLYQIEQLATFKDVWLLGGELKAVVAKRLLNKHGIGAVSTTVGEGNWDASFTPEFKGKRVYICYDVDSDGVAGARNAAMHLQYEAEQVYIVALPLDKTKYPKGDINDYVGQEGATDADLLECRDNAVRWERPPTAEEEDALQVDPLRVDLGHATDASNMVRPIEVEAVVSAMDTTPFIVAKEVAVSCTRDQPNCPWCPVKLKEVPADGVVSLTVKGSSPGVLEMIGSSKKFQREAVREALKIPPCKAAEFTVKTHMNVVDVRLSPQLTLNSAASEHVVLPAFVVQEEVELNTPYRFSGRLLPSPKNQQAVLLMSGVEQVEDSLDSFNPSNGELEELRAFSCSDKDVPGKISSIQEDLAANVTRIYKRDELHVVLDLTYHSVLLFQFEGRDTKGWVNSLILGDSSQGKSEVCLRMMEHYGLGERVECKSASVAGLLGGLQQIGNRWFVSWGVIPNHDRRLVILEEVKGAPVDVISKLTDMRSSGIAEIPKIERRRALARTRLVFVSNPRSDRPLSAYNFGVEAIKELIGGLEDVRRFDIAYLASATQIPAEEINRLRSAKTAVPHTVTSALCRRLILWTWTRRPEDVCFREDTLESLMKGAAYLCGKFTEAMPLVDRGTMRLKLARLSAALAARLFSTPDLRCLEVKPCHVQYVTGLVDRLYSDKIFGYADYTEAQVHANSVRDPGEVVKRIRSTKHPADLVESLLYASEITVNDIMDWTGLDRDDAQVELSFLVRKHALYRTKYVYVKTTEFIEVLKKMRADGLPASTDVKGAKF